MSNRKVQQSGFQQSKRHNSTGSTNESGAGVNGIEILDLTTDIMDLTTDIMDLTTDIMDSTTNIIDLTKD
jgi:hypothetical protein